MGSWKSPQKVGGYREKVGGKIGQNGWGILQKRLGGKKSGKKFGVSRKISGGTSIRIINFLSTNEVHSTKKLHFCQVKQIIWAWMPKTYHYDVRKHFSSLECIRLNLGQCFSWNEFRRIALTEKLVTWKK